eukprot:3416706-Karenia_brevis.AAC.1
MKRTWSSVLGPSTSLRTLGNVTSQTHQDVSRALDEYKQVATPYGLLICDTELQLLNGGVHKWSYLNPFAVLFLLCQNVEYFNMVAQYLTGSIAGMLLYCDETNPGDPLRPDMARQVMCFYYTFAEFPGWFRARSHGWLVLGVLRTDVLKNVAGALTGVYKH